MNEVFNFSVDKLYDLLFTDSPFQRDFMEQRRFSGQSFRFQGWRLPSLPSRPHFFLFFPSPLLFQAARWPGAPPFHHHHPQGPSGSSSPQCCSFMLTLWAPGTQCQAQEAHLWARPPRAHRLAESSRIHSLAGACGVPGKLCYLV